MPVGSRVHRPEARVPLVVRGAACRTYVALEARSEYGPAEVSAGVRGVRTRACKGDRTGLPEHHVQREAVPVSL